MVKENVSFYLIQKGADRQLSEVIPNEGSAHLDGSAACTTIGPLIMLCVKATVLEKTSKNLSTNASNFGLIHVLLS